MGNIHNFSNLQISEILGNVAAALIVKNQSKFRIMAYEKASQAISNLSTEAFTLWREGKLNTISGIGKQMTEYLTELFTKGKVKHFSQVFHLLPPAMFALLKIPGIGPKNSFKLCKLLKLHSQEKAIELLKTAAEKGKIRLIGGFGEKSESDILRAIQAWKQRGNKMLLATALSISENIVVYLKKCSNIQKIEVLGSLRRKSPLVGDIDIAIISNRPKKAIDYFLNYPEKKEIIAAGETKASILLINNKQIDLRVVDSSCWGSLLQHFTGSKQHNIHLREIALGKGISLSEYGIKKLKTPWPPAARQNSNAKLKTQMPKPITFSDEKKFYQYLGMKWIEPELREDRGEIEGALKHNLPNLVELNYIKGDLHLHSSFNIESSHDSGLDSMEEMVKKAYMLNYEYVAFSEHNPSSSQHNDHQIYNIIKSKKEIIDKLNYSRENIDDNRKHKLFIFNSLEIDIKPNGNRAVSDKCLELLDFAIVAVHSAFKLDRSAMTARILLALNHPKVKILAHPTGRLLNQRFGYELNWEQIFSFCVKNNKYLEINSLPNRLDLPDDLIKEAIKFGVKMIINTDSHSLEQMNNICYGVFNARRGWATASDIINTLAYNELKAKLTK